MRDSSPPSVDVGKDSEEDETSGSQQLPGSGSSLETDADVPPAAEAPSAPPAPKPLSALVTQEQQVQQEDDDDFSARTEDAPMAGPEVTEEEEGANSEARPSILASQTKPGLVSQILECVEAEQMNLANALLDKVRRLGRNAAVFGNCLDQFFNLDTKLKIQLLQL